MAPVALAFALLVFCTGGSASLAAESCTAPDPVCAARQAVFQIGAFKPFGSAVRIAPDLLVANRHVVADEERVTVRLSNGEKVAGDVVPTSFAGDLILIRAGLPDGPALARSGKAVGDLYTVGLDIGTLTIAVFAKGGVLLQPAAGKPFARLYHTAHSQPGTSGGALVDARGALVAIVASGSEGRNEAVPAGQIATLEAESGPEHGERSRTIGKAYRECSLLVEQAKGTRDVVPPDVSDKIDRACSATGNRQLFDLAGQVFGVSRMFDRSIAFFRRGLEKDPNAVSTRLSLVVILAYAQRFEPAAEHVRWLLDVIPENQELQRYGIRVGKETGDEAMMARALALIEAHNPAGLEAAKRFVESRRPPPRRP